METNRKYKRFNVPVGVKFRPTYGARDFSSAVTTDISCEGVGLDAHDFKFFLHENLELILETPLRGSTISVSGDIIWKKQSGKRCIAGINFTMPDKDMQKKEVEKLFSSLKIPLDSMYSNDRNYAVEKGIEQTLKPESAGPVINPMELPNKLGLIKEYNENGTSCRVTFRLLRELANDAGNVTIVGDFNNWDISRSSMIRLENGDFVTTITIDSNKEYRYMYLIDGKRWENDWYAEKYVRNDKGVKESVVIV